MKLLWLLSQFFGILSHPARGAWIEIMDVWIISQHQRSHPARGAWIEMRIEAIASSTAVPSHPARGAWIEIIIDYTRHTSKYVAPRKGCVD